MSSVELTLFKFHAVNTKNKKQTNKQTNKNSLTLSTVGQSEVKRPHVNVNPLI